MNKAMNEKEKQVTPVEKPRFHTQTHRLRHFYAEICTTKLAATMIEKKRQQKGVLSLSIVNHKSSEQKKFFFSYSTDSVNCKAPPKRKNVNKLLESVLLVKKKKKVKKHRKEVP